MVLDWFRSFIEIVFDPLIDDAKVAVSEEGHKIGHVLVRNLTAGNKDLKSTHQQDDQSFFI